MPRGTPLRGGPARAVGPRPPDALARPCAAGGNGYGSKGEARAAMPGQMIIDRYQVERPIGSGGMGTVWLARDQRLGRNVAIKQIGLLPGETAPNLARAMREARSSAVLNHPHVVSVFDVVEEKDQIWLVMEYVASRTLLQIIN